jgi:AcrR family transcriptional regulator
MSRPRSDDKRKAIMDAAVRVFAERGIANSPTSAISTAAGISDGSLFTYFKTKDELMGELYRELRLEFSRHLQDFPHGESARTRLKYIWDQYLKLGAEHPEQLKVLAQLRASGKLFKENEEPGFAFVAVLQGTHDAVEGSELGSAPPEYLVLMLRAQAEMTIDYINAHPESAELCRELGFKVVWAGLTGK